MRQPSLNALQHSPAGSAIRARLQQDGTRVELAIEDDGEGIAPQDLPYVFDRFYRGDPSRSEIQEEPAWGSHL